MNNIKSLMQVNNSIYNGKSYYRNNEVEYPCMGLKPYYNNKYYECTPFDYYYNCPCDLCFRCNSIVVPPGPMPPIPPMPPMPPMPPIPPTPRLDHAILEGAGVIDNSFPYPLVPIEIVGDTIEYEVGFFSVRLAPNRRYRFTWRSITEVNAMPFLIQGLLIDATGADWPDSLAQATMTTRPGIVELSKSGILEPNGPQSVIFLFLSNIGPLPTSGTLEIELLP